MKKRFSVFSLLITVLVLAGFVFMVNDSFAVVKDIFPLMDNTIYQGQTVDPNTGNVIEDHEDNTCGGGPHVFVGRTSDGLLRRALFKFDIFNNLPSPSVINSVTLTLNINRGADNQDAPMTLNALNQDWTEGALDCTAIRGGGQGIDSTTADGGATWIYSTFNTVPWAGPGGQTFTLSATEQIPSSGAAVWNSANNPQMVADVQSWLNDQTTNNGWIIIGDETRINTTRRMDSREGRIIPVLTVDYTPDVPIYACCFTDGSCNDLPQDQNDPTGTACSDAGGTPFLNNTCADNICPQPAGACCNADESCSDNVPRDVCLAGGGTFQGETSQCSDNSVNCGLEPFVDPLPIPGVLQPVGTRADGVLQYEVTQEEVSQQLHRDLPNTDVWGYNGLYPGPTIEATSNVPIEVKYINNLPGSARRGRHLFQVDFCPHGPNYWRDTSRTVVHLHGAHVQARFDGQPELTILPGEFDVYEYSNLQLPATLWYHDHALGITRLNVYAGLAAYYILRDDFENGLGLPSGEFEIPAVIQDRSFFENGELFYPPTIQNAFFGDKTVVNGKVWPFLNVKQGKYRFRFLNGSNARTYTLRLEDLANPGGIIPFTLIGTDGGLISAPIDLNTITMGPAERFDVIIDFSGFSVNAEIVLKNDDTDLPRLFNVMKFIVQDQIGFTNPIPNPLRDVPPINATPAKIRGFELRRDNTEECAGFEWLIDELDVAGNVIGSHWDDVIGGVDANTLSTPPLLGTTEIWEIHNTSNIMHPMHIHLVQFQILERIDLVTGNPLPLDAWEVNTWKDTVRALPNTTTRVIMTFEDYAGKFPFHCHILDHEDHEMMRQFQTTSGVCNGNGICETGEDSLSCPDCKIVSGAFCGNGLCEVGDGEDCTTCPEDCNGKQKGGNRFCCGAGGQNPIPDCGILGDGTVYDDRCISDGYFCRVAPKVRASCGDTICEGQEQVQGPDFCQIDCAPGGGGCSAITNRDDCNADPNCIWEGGKNSGMCVDAPPTQCTYNDPGVTINPTAQDITTDGGSALYTVSVTNNDNAACAATTFNLSVTDTDTGVNFVVPATLSLNSVTLDPGASQNVDLTVTGQAGAPNGTVNDTSVTAADPAGNHVDVTSNTVTTTINVGGQVCEDINDRDLCRSFPQCQWKKGNCITR